MPEVVATRGRRRREAGPRLLVGSLLVLLLLASPYFGVPSWTPYVAATAVLTGIAATGINMMLGSAGLLNLGAGLFVGFGGYAAGLGAQFLHLPLAVAILAGVAGAMVFAALIGWLLVQLPRFYFAVATLGLAIALSGLLAAIPNVTGGASGLIGGGSLAFGSFSVQSPNAWYLLALVVAVPTLLVVRLMTRGRRTRAYAMLRDDELAASGLGIPVLRMKLEMFVVAAGVMAFAGALLFAFQGVVVPQSAGLTQSVQLLGVAVVGGITSEYGGLVGAALLVWLQSLVSGLGDTELVVYGGVFVLVILFMNEGLTGLWRRAWAAGGGVDGAFAPARGEKAPERRPLAVEGIAEGQPAGRGSEGREDAPGAPRPPGLEVRNVRRVFGGVVAVDDASLDVPWGSVTALIGLNGAGKTTLLNIISGFEPPDRGSVSLGGVPIESMSPQERARLGLARTFQVPRLVDHLSLFENVLLGAEFCGPERRGAAELAFDRRRAAFEALEQVGLAARAFAPVASLPSGHRKQAELARALVSRPRALILDEPAVGLASEDIDKVAAVIRRVAEAGAAVLVVDHNLDFVGRIADRVLVMELGRVAELDGGGDGAAADGEAPARRYEKVFGAAKGWAERKATGLARTRPAAAEVTGGPAAPEGAAPAGCDLRVVGVRAGYGTLTVLHDIAFSVPYGELLCVTGPNGAGKTTLLATIAGAIRPHAGEIWFGGQRIDALAPHRRVALGVALVPSGRGIFASLSVGANLDVTALASGRARVDAAHVQRREELLDMFPVLRQRFHQPAGRLSGGEQQMLAIARALMCRPKLLLLDEPTQGLAASLVEELARALRSLSGSTSVVVAEHSEVFLSTADRVVELRMGRLDAIRMGGREVASWAPGPAGS